MGIYTSIYIFLLIYNAVLISTTQLPLLHIYICICILFHVIFPCDLSQSIFLAECFLSVYYHAFWAVLGLCCCAWAFSSCGEQGLLFAALGGLLVVVLLLLQSVALGTWAPWLQLAGSRVLAE